MGLTPHEYETMTPREFTSAFKGYLWGRERLLKDMSWMTANIINHCRYPSKKNRVVKQDQLFKVGQDKEKMGNPFYRQVLGIDPRR